MSESRQRFSYTEAQDAAYDRLDHQGFTPDEIRHRLGMKASSIVRLPEPPLTTADHKPATRKAAATVQYGDNMRIETTTGRPVEDDGPRPTAEEQARTHYWTQHWREEAEKSKETSEKE